MRWPKISIMSRVAATAGALPYWQQTRLGQMNWDRFRDFEKKIHKIRIHINFKRALDVQKQHIQIGFFLRETYGIMRCFSLGYILFRQPLWENNQAARNQVLTFLLNAPNFNWFTYSEDFLLEESKLSDIGLELSLGGGSLASKELFSRRQLDELTLAIDQSLVLSSRGLVALGTIDQGVGHD